MTPNILMVAAENDALPGSKVGGIGDVLRHLPPALVALGCKVTVISPAYGLLAEMLEPRRIASLEVGFRGTAQHVEAFEVSGRDAPTGVRHLVLDHPGFSVCGRGMVYCNDPPDRPFASDASKFALFAAAVAEGLLHNRLGSFDVAHLHDWHAALVLLLRQFHPGYRALRTLRCVYTIHNLALQGVRPLRGDDSALESWFPGLRYDNSLVVDPRWPDCINPMAVGIRLADAVHTVSPSYAREILLPSAVDSNGYYGGEGLEADLTKVQAAGHLHGFLNGCEYPKKLSPAPKWRAMLALMQRENLRWIAERDTLSAPHFLAHTRLEKLGAKRPAVVMTSVGRVTEQKMRLLQTPCADGRSALENVLDALGDNGLLVILGSGEGAVEQFVARICATRENALFLCGYSEVLAQALYAGGDLFLMPSSFEPCGISQMLALRAGQPCVVHHVGGLKDTVEPGVNGFSFNGDSLAAQADGLVAAVGEALTAQADARRWRALKRAAADARFPWRASAEACLERLYRPG